MVIENPQQKYCLQADMARYIARIPPRFGSLIELVNYLVSAPFVRDALGTDDSGNACIPAQRSRIWPNDYNCWEATAHFAAEAARLLPDNWIVLIRDVTDGNKRHVWPTLILAGKLAPPGFGDGRPIANEWYNDLFGGIHFAGDKVLRFFGAGAVSDMIADKSGDALPDWARTSEQLARKATTTEASPIPTEQPSTAPIAAPIVPTNRPGAMDDAI
jgi:hypothetical protein